jgi:cobalt-zinc-cadmium efflux system outer membrane protein
VWLETVKQRELLDIRKKSYREQLSLMEKDSIRRAEEGVRDLDALQNRVETGVLYTEIMELENELFNLYHQLSSMSGIKGLDTIIMPIRRNILNTKEYSLDRLIDLALENRSDVIAAYKEIDLYSLNIKAAKLERVPEFDIIFGYLFAIQSRISDLPTEKAHGVKLGISIPIPLFDRNKGGILSAEIEKRQSEYRYQQALVNLKRDVISSYNNFIAADKKMKFFSSGLVRGAKEVLDQKREEYFRGEVHLIEVIEAQRSYDDILLSFFASIYVKSISVVQLESTVGIWDVN